MTSCGLPFVLNWMAWPLTVKLMILRLFLRLLAPPETNDALVPATYLNPAVLL